MQAATSEPNVPFPGAFPPSLVAWCRSRSETLDRCEPMLGDASTRRYLRLVWSQGMEGASQPSATSHVLMLDDVVTDQGPALAQFLDMRDSMAQRGCPVPEVLTFDVADGWAVLEDLGDWTLARCLEEGRSNLDLTTEAADALTHPYPHLLAALLPWQLSEVDLTPFVARCWAREMDLYTTWYADRYLQHPLSPSEQRVWEAADAWLQAQALEQPQCPAHRDYHSRNVMWHRGAWVWLDVQDAVLAPWAYDAVSLLRDAYIDPMPQHVMDHHLVGYWRASMEAGVLPATTEWPMVQRWFNAVSVQRLLKVLGIFARLALRDGKTTYLEAMPNVWQQVMAATSACSALQDLQDLLAARSPAVSKGGEVV